MELLISSSALPRPRTQLSLPSLRSPSMIVKKSKSLQTYSNIQVQPSLVVLCVLDIPTALTQTFLHFPSTFSPRSLLGALLRLRGSLSGLRLQWLRPVPHGICLDPEQRAHPEWGDCWDAARHPFLCRSQSGQDGRHRPGGDLLQTHGAVNRDTPVKTTGLFERPTWIYNIAIQYCIQCVLPGLCCETQQ